MLTQNLVQFIPRNDLNNIEVVGTTYGPPQGPLLLSILASVLEVHHHLTPPLPVAELRPHRGAFR